MIFEQKKQKSVSKKKKTRQVYNGPWTSNLSQQQLKKFGQK